MQLLYQPEIASLTLDKEESRHCVQVLRKKTGDLIWVTDGLGNLYKATMTDDDKRKVSFRIIEKQSFPAPSFRRIIAIAPTKSVDRLEWFVEKCVELGIDEIIFMVCDHSERRQIKLERLLKKAISAMKQSIKYTVPTLIGPESFDEVIQRTADQRFIAYVNEENPAFFDLIRKNESAMILIGPEGDFSPREVALATSKGFSPVGLGPSRLRTETAGIAACHMLNLIND